MTVKQLKDYLNSAEGKYDNYEILCFHQEELEITKLEFPNRGELISKEDNEISPILFLYTRTLGSIEAITKRYSVKMNAFGFKIG